MGNTDYEGLVTFHNDLQVMEVDFSDFTFSDNEVVDQFYDVIERRIEQTGRDWYFMVNYHNCQIYPNAWVRYSQRGKNVNIAHSLGTVRFDPSEETKQEILEKARTDHFNPNLVASRDDALARIEEMKRAG